MSYTQFLSKFRRITTSGDFIPEIDGLRFIAIAVVVLFHLQGWMLHHKAYIILDKPTDYPVIYWLFKNGWQGVELFFVISGFILGLPFAKEKIHGGRKIKLKSYFMRRLTRLEPPYIVAMIIFFFMMVSSGENTFKELLPSLASTLTYTHNLIYGKTLYVTAVAWSLEIEVQFYLLAPLLASVFLLPKIMRRFVMFAVIIGFPLLREHYWTETVTLYMFIEFFMMGFLLADLYLDEKKINFGKIPSLLLGAASLGVLIYVSHSRTINHQLVYLLAIFIFYYLVFHNEFWKGVFSRPTITTIGGMCYSIYLTHTMIISFLNNHLHKYQIFHYYVPSLLFNTVICVALVLVISGIFFKFIERPCMDKHWPTKLKNWFSAKINSTKQEPVMVFQQDKAFSNRMTINQAKTETVLEKAE